MSDIATTRRQLKIKSGATKRLLKENNSYRKEAEEQKRKVDKLVADGAEDWEVRQANNLLRESDKMVKDSSDRLGANVQDLRDLVLSAKKDPALAEDEGLLQADGILEEAST